MAEIAPFRGIRYDPDAVGDLSSVVAPPYDVIGEAEREALEEASPYNIVRLVLPREEPEDEATSGKYTRARAMLDAWRAAGVLREDDDEALYVYEERYDVDGERRVQRGVLAAVQLDDPDAGGVLPHERTYPDIVADRLNLLRATRTNLDCIFCVYSSPETAAADAIDATARTEPLSRFRTPNGVEHLLWAMTDRARIDAVARALEKAQVVIADGHHRHQTAQYYRAERRAADGSGPWDAQLMFLVDATRWGPTLLPIHRVVAGLDADEALRRIGTALTVEPAPTTEPEELARAVAERRAHGRTYAMLSGDRAWFLTVADPATERAALPADRSSAWRDLDVSVLHFLVFDRLLGGIEPGFVHSAAEAAARIAEGGGSLAFLLAPPPFDAVRAVAEAGDAMPQKSTYFIPKPTTGIVLRALE